MGKLVQRLAKSFQFDCLLMTKRSVAAAAALELITIAPALRVERFERVADRTIHRQVGHERPVTMGAMEDHASLKMAVRQLKILAAILADDRNYPAQRIKLVALLRRGGRGWLSCVGSVEAATAPGGATALSVFSSVICRDHPCLRSANPNNRSSRRQFKTTVPAHGIAPTPRYAKVVRLCIGDFVSVRRIKNDKPGDRDLEGPVSQPTETELRNDFQRYQAVLPTYSYKLTSLLMSRSSVDASGSAICYGARSWVCCSASPARWHGC